MRLLLWTLGSIMLCAAMLQFLAEIWIWGATSQYVRLITLETLTGLRFPGAHLPLSLPGFILGAVGLGLGKRLNAR